MTKQPLEDKIDEILGKPFKIDGKVVEYMIPRTERTAMYMAIMKAVEDEGYHYISDKTSKFLNKMDDIYSTELEKAENHNIEVRKSFGLMTGQEWYDRFEKNLRLAMHWPDSISLENFDKDITGVLKAAKKAAGIE